VQTQIIVLAAGKGTRMRSALPKVLHLLAGKPLLAHVLDTARSLPDQRTWVVAGGAGGPAVRQACGDYPVSWVEQREQLGTAHAVSQVLPELDDQGTALILYGDVPLLAPATLTTMVASAAEGALVLLTVHLADPAGYGRILRDTGGAVTGIIEEKDATVAQRALTEINTGIMAMPVRKLRAWLARVGNANAQGEYYLTDIVALAAVEGTAIQTLHPRSPEEVEGVNDRAQLARLERRCQHRLAERLMAAGATLADPARFDCRGELSVGHDVFIDINCVFEGRVTLGDDVRIGPGCVIRDAEIGRGALIKANTVIEGPAVVAAGAQVGPFARLREGTRIGEQARIGNFVETKQAEFGRGSKANHLAYVGDARLGEDVNVGAGTITCNYDGAAKHRTEIGDGAFIGSNSALVAPVAVGPGATVGAGSTITVDVPAGHLGIGRGKQRNIPGWRRPPKKDDH
jgi:bifunctional UDP-N-acetylglucosamine pyrophosphorylase/glucosamine-1-phosphate N-acetyltransferase